MRLYYANATYKKTDLRGRNIHIHQFIANSIELGHEIWMEPDCEHPGIHPLPKGRLARWRSLRRLDAIYVRLQDFPPVACRYGIAPYRQLAGSPLNVWEFNTVPEFSIVMQHNEERLQNSLAAFRRFGPGCDLAVCVSSKLAEYVQEYLGINKTMVVPNGSDPSLFLPKSRLIPAVQTNPHSLNIVWIGSADLGWHNFDQMLEAAKILVSRGLKEKFTFHIIGKDLPKNTGWEDNVIYHGPVAYDCLPGWLAPMDVGLVLYRSGVADYNSPLKFYDYLASELAVVSSEQPQVREVLTSMNASDMLVPCGNATALADTLQSLEEDRERVRLLGTSGRQKVVEFYNWQRAALDTYTKMAELFH